MTELPVWLCLACLAPMPAAEHGNFWCEFCQEKTAARMYDPDVACRVLRTQIEIDEITRKDPAI